MNNEKEAARVVHEVAVETRRLLSKAKSEAPRSTDPKVVMDQVLTKIENLLDESLLSSDQICQLLDCLKVRYSTEP